MQLLTGIDQSDYSKIESGKRHYTFEQCKKIVADSEISMDYLAELTDTIEPYPRKNSKKRANPFGLALKFYLKG